MTDPTKLKSPQVIDTRAVSGGHELTWPLTLTSEATPPLNISGATVVLSLGTDAGPDGVWHAPDVDHAGADEEGTEASVLNQRTVQLMIGLTLKPADGLYRLWSRISMSGQESVPRAQFQIRVLADS